MNAPGEARESLGDTAPRLTRAGTASFQGHETNRPVGRWTGLRARLMLFVKAVLLGPFGMAGYDKYEDYQIIKNQTIHNAIGLATR